MEMKRVLLTGGGTAGHVTPNLALLPALMEKGYQVEYIGSYEGIEKQLIEKAGIPYHGISTGKLRRYFSLKNLTDPFRVLKGYGEAKKLVKAYRPDVLFSKGGFVAVPVVFAARKYHIPIVIHESDMTPGLANRLCIPKADKVCCNFPETMKHLPEEKAVLSGSPIRRELLQGERLAGLKFTGLSANRPVLLMMGGSLGSAIINENLRKILPDLLKDFQVIHLCGKGKTVPGLKLDGYVQYEYISKELKDLMAAADIVLSRAGANSICEFLALHKPNILIPLSAAASRGDQILNAKSFEKQGYSYVIEEERLNEETLLSGIRKVYAERRKYISAMENSKLNDGVQVVSGLLEGFCENGR